MEENIEKIIYTGYCPNEETNCHCKPLGEVKFHGIGMQACKGGYFPTYNCPNSFTLTLESIHRHNRNKKKD